MFSFFFISNAVPSNTSTLLNCPVSAPGRSRRHWPPCLYTDRVAKRVIPAQTLVNCALTTRRQSAAESAPPPTGSTQIPMKQYDSLAHGMTNLSVRLLSTYFPVCHLSTHYCLDTTKSFENDHISLFTLNPLCGCSFVRFHKNVSAQWMLSTL